MPILLAGVSVTCFTPNPATTQGEAQEIRRLAAAQHWNTIIVVTSTYHVSRARMIIERCFDGRLEVVAARTHISLLDWAYQFAYQTGWIPQGGDQPGLLSRCR